MKNENGVTLMALIITLTVMAIIGLTVFYTAEGLDTKVEDDVLIAELKTVHHIVLQERNKKLTLGDEYNYKGTNPTTEIFNTINTNLNSNLSYSIDKYYILTPDNFIELGAKNVGSTYLVCYGFEEIDSLTGKKEERPGEVANITQYKTSAGEVLYTK